MRGSKLSSRAIVLAVLFACWASPAMPLETREVLATGSSIPRFGSVGLLGVELLGLDDRGRLLIAGSLSDGRRGLYWADESGVSTLWSAEGPARQHISLGTDAIISPGGRVVDSGYNDSGEYALFALEPGSLRRLIGVGDPAPDGEVFCDLHQYRWRGSPKRRSLRSRSSNWRMTTRSSPVYSS